MVRKPRRHRKRSLLNSLNKKYTTYANNTEESRRLLINNSFIGNKFHDKWSLNVHDITKVTINHTKMSAAFFEQVVATKKTCIHLDKTKILQ